MSSQHPGDDAAGGSGNPGDPAATPPIEDLADSMLVMYGGHDDDHEEPGTDTESPGLYRPNSREPLFPVDPDRYEAMHAATRRDSSRYLHEGMTPISCHRCAATVDVKKLAPGYTLVQWNTKSRTQCMYFSELEEQGRPVNRDRGCPHMSQSIRDATSSGELVQAPDPVEGVGDQFG